MVARGSQGSSGLVSESLQGMEDSGGITAVPWWEEDQQGGWQCCLSCLASVPPVCCNWDTLDWLYWLAIQSNEFWKCLYFKRITPSTNISSRSEGENLAIKNKLKLIIASEKFQHIIDIDWNSSASSQLTRLQLVVG